MIEEAHELLDRAFEVDIVLLERVVGIKEQMLTIQRGSRRGVLLT